jgi:hypothetical protein
MMTDTEIPIKKTCGRIKKFTKSVKWRCYIGRRELKIDHLVYQLYDLIKEEIAIVKGKK